MDIFDFASALTCLLYTSFENSLTAEVTETSEEKKISFEIADEFNNIVNSVEMKVGDTVQNKARTEDENAEVTYTSSDEAVVTVDENGTVTAVAAGSAVSYTHL